ncbi:hypothetical protein AWENTII_008263 [Aspergillus wentii]
MKLSSSILLLGAVAQQGYAHFLEKQYPERCDPDPCAGITFQNKTYVCGDPRLGPVNLPKNFPLSTELQTYSRFGDLCPYEFLEKWATDIAPVLGNISLKVGQKVDRFGSEFGTFLAVLGAPYIERALPPSNLDTYDGAYPFNYYVYEVTKPFVVSGGPIAGWFEQPGLGTQFAAFSPVKDLISGGYLRRLGRSEYDQKEEYSASYLPAPSSAPSSVPSSA